MIPPEEIDQLILSFCVERWRKVARVFAEAMQSLEARGIKISDALSDQLDARMKVLVDNAQLEAKGDIREWRFSEVRKPAPKPG